jgi:hypothetical protein
MSSSAVELQPDPDEVLQAEEPAGTEPTVNVKVTTPVRTQALPRKGGATFTKPLVALTAGPALQVLRADHRRAQAILIGAAPILVAYGDASAQDPSTMALLPAGVLLPVSGTVDVWVAAATGTTTVSVLTELWATGEGSD